MSLSYKESWYNLYQVAQIWRLWTERISGFDHFKKCNQFYLSVTVERDYGVVSLFTLHTQFSKLSKNVSYPFLRKNLEIPSKLPKMFRKPFHSNREKCFISFIYLSYAIILDLGLGEFSILDLWQIRLHMCLATIGIGVIERMT